MGAKMRFHQNNDHIVFTTSRLTVRLASSDDVELFYQLWTDPWGTSNVGFPQGIPVSRAQIRERIERSGASEFEHLLVIELNSTGQSIGECSVSRPNAQKIAFTDVKLLPQFWGNKYGFEVKRGLLNHLFTHTDCEEVEATPNVDNRASINMQEAVGGVCVGEKLFEFPESMQSYTSPVKSYIYRVRRKDWQERSL